MKSTMMLECFEKAIIGILCGAGSLAFGQTTVEEGGSSLLDSLLNTKITSVSKYEQTLEDAPAAVSILTGSDIETYGFQTVAEALATIRGFYFSYDRDYSYLGVRGFGRPSDFNNRVLLLLDGHVLNEDVFGSALLGTESGVNLSMIDRIEIVRGSLSSLYGTGALLASINIVTKKGREIDGFRADVEAGTFKSYRGSVLFGKEFNNGVGLVGSAQWGSSAGPDLYYKEFDSPSTGNGVTRSNDADLYRSFYIDAHYSPFSVRAFLSGRDKHVPTAYYNTLFGDSRTTTFDQRGFLQAAFDQDLNDEIHFTAHASFDSYSFAGTYPYAELYQQDEAEGRWVGGEMQLRWDTSIRNRLVLGIDYSHHGRSEYRFWDDNGLDIFFDKPFDQLSTYLSDQFDVNSSLSFTASLRRDSYSFTGSSLSPRGALVYRPWQSTTCKLMYGEAFRVPNTYEREYDDPLGSFQRNPDLKPERIRTAELLVEHRFISEVLATVSVFHYEIRDLIDQGINPVDSILEYQNVSKAVSNGIESEVDIFLEFGAKAYLRYIYQRTRDTYGVQLTNSPDHIARAGFFLPVSGKFGVSLESSWESGRRTILGAPTSGVFLANAALTIHPFGNWFGATLRIRNVFNTSYAYPAGFEHSLREIPQDGRTMYLRCTISL